MVQITNKLDNLNWNELESVFLSAGWKKHKKDLLIRVFLASSFVAIAYEEGKIVGCGRVLSDGEMYACVYDVVIHSEYQGKGIGKAIMSNILSELKDIPFVHLTATTGNELFYTKLGLKKHNTAMARSLNPEYTNEYLSNF
ncbi:Acetyltransferase (GNAT) domain-containing protein [Marininema mesophilum]|uniref:Acetyltransferase (GNAT) domain-containing protein n=1 Tax=Marininema mesophilum TaxID=1048340 RepID=A0A1H2PYE4_9BACL|nr:GNAT family N-acetyltransferase [Marininema mesophilum]SDV99883.1 Acetyltransferase (GNAT) domain-containing protein [Marininema mesophilum]